MNAALAAIYSALFALASLLPILPGLLVSIALSFVIRICAAAERKVDGGADMVLAVLALVPIFGIAWLLS